MIIDPMKDGLLTGTYINDASHSSHVKEKLIGSCGNGIPATFGFVVNFEVSLYHFPLRNVLSPDSYTNQIMRGQVLEQGNLKELDDVALHILKTNTSA